MRGFSRLLSVVRMTILAVAIAATGGGVIIAGSIATANVAEAAVVSAISVRGNTRMDSDTVISFLTIEPGIYIAPGLRGVAPRFRGIGIRIEDDVLITRGAPEVLTAAAPKTVGVSLRP